MFRNLEIRFLSIVLFFVFITLYNINVPLNTEKVSSEDDVTNRLEIVREERPDINLSTAKNNSNVLNMMQTNSGDYEVDYNGILYKIILEQKFKCLFMKKKSILYLYHMRKTAGTLTRKLMLFLSKILQIQYLEAEGQIVNTNFLGQYGILSVISLRHPVERVISLYWYEHVLYYLSLHKKRGKASNMRAWVMNWKDNSTWKQNYTSRYPGNVYVEVENYYVKALSGWTGDHSINENDLMKAKEALQKFDLIFLSELINKGIQDDVFRSFFSMKFKKVPSSLSIDKNVIKHLTPTLAADESEIRAMLTDINKFDLELYEYAKTLVNKRLPIIMSAMEITRQQAKMPSSSSYNNIYLSQFLNETNNFVPKFTNTHHEQLHNKIISLKTILGPYQCDSHITTPMKDSLKIIRPPNHKMPVNMTYDPPPKAHVSSPVKGRGSPSNKIRNSYLRHKFADYKKNF